MVVQRSDNELPALMRETLYPSIIDDISNKIDYLRQFLPRRIQPMRENMVVTGRVMTVPEADALETVSEGQNPIMRQSFGLMLEALDDLKKNEVYICTGSPPTYTLVGESICTRVKILGTVGVVMNGFHHNTSEVPDLDFPYFSYGGYIQGQGPGGEMTDYRIPINIKGVRINLGSIVFGGSDGILIIPREAGEEMIVRVVEKATGERIVTEAIRNGMAAKASLDKHGIM